MAQCLNLHQKKKRKMKYFKTSIAEISWVPAQQGSKLQDHALPRLHLLTSNFGIRGKKLKPNLFYSQILVTSFQARGNKCVYRSKPYVFFQYF